MNTQDQCSGGLVFFRCRRAALRYAKRLERRGLGADLIKCPVAGRRGMWAAIAWKPWEET